MANAQAAAAANEEQNASFSTKKPVATVRQGNVKIAIWPNEGKNGTFYTASQPTVTYKDDKGAYHDGSSFSRHDLLDSAEASREAAAKINELSRTRAESVSR
jgi:hypothetical protein